MAAGGNQTRLGAERASWPLRSLVQMQPVPMPEEYDESGTKGMSSTSGDTKVGSVLNGRFVISPLIA